MTVLALVVDCCGGRTADRHIRRAAAVGDGGGECAAPSTPIHTNAHSLLFSSLSPIPSPIRRAPPHQRPAKTRGASDGTRKTVTDTLDAAARLGFTVVRAWAFNDGPGWNALQTAPGVYSEEVFRGLDWAVSEAGKRGLKLMLTLTNFWEDFGGFPQYVRWSKGLPDGSPAKGEQFYGDAKARRMFLDFATAVVTRVNTVTGVAYK